MHPITMLGGGKGGVGKTTIALASGDAITHGGQPLVAIDCDRENPRFYKTYAPLHDANPGGNLMVAALDLDEAEGWSRIVDISDEFADSHILIDTPAGSHSAYRKFADVLRGSLGELKREWRTVFVINGQRDSIELLADFVEMTPADHVIHVIANGFFGEDARCWEKYNSSRTKQAIDRRGGKTIHIPRLSPHVVTAIDWQRLTYSDAMVRLTMGERAVLGSWLTAVRRDLGRVLLDS